MVAGKAEILLAYESILLIPKKPGLPIPDFGMQ